MLTWYFRKAFWGLLTAMSFVMTIWVSGKVPEKIMEVNLGLRLAFSCVVAIFFFSLFNWIEERLERRRDQQDAGDLDGPPGAIA
ncbi:MAG: hypothetical protein UV58_C0006G0012 [Candidatus Wolfebacteria bacterium GW2011_GWC1_43_10]|uniref:Uncharacterized protein n=1 Tax=Candidatus Wolfebacteria bacterium GW2011_GWC1_43_10 TaxID=1619011 RepID=A0A0G1F788_9BACT|nr:MAG: hypothetical protein UV58_C0006G0012 [Candidatus Wolfebacteria bacterium GW2011_GWC1_43_10]KKT22918.1 MAG: hypothetical protein UW08_C0002G0047 [Parcubacteria group bacterium GW2011_GWB1_43_8b]